MVIRKALPAPFILCPARDLSPPLSPPPPPRQKGRSTARLLPSSRNPGRPACTRHSGDPFVIRAARFQDPSSPTGFRHKEPGECLSPTFSCRITYFSPVTQPRFSRSSIGMQVRNSDFLFTTQYTRTSSQDGALLADLPAPRRFCSFDPASGDFLFFASSAAPRPAGARTAPPSCRHLNVPPRTRQRPARRFAVPASGPASLPIRFPLVRFLPRRRGSGSAFPATRSIHPDDSSGSSLILLSGRGTGLFFTPPALPRPLDAPARLLSWRDGAQNALSPLGRIPVPLAEGHQFPSKITAAFPHCRSRSDLVPQEGPGIAFPLPTLDTFGCLTPVTHSRFPALV